MGKIQILHTSADGFPFVEEVIDVSTPLMMQPENWPEGFHLSLSLVRLCFSWDGKEKQIQKKKCVNNANELCHIRYNVSKSTFHYGTIFSIAMSAGRFPNNSGTFLAAPKALQRLGTCFVIRSDSQMVFHFIPKLLDGIDLRSLCRSLRNLIMILTLRTWGFVMLKREQSIPNLFLQNCNNWLETNQEPFFLK